jgi:hypothetical protein
MVIAWSCNVGLSLKAWNAHPVMIIGSLTIRKILDHMELYYLQKNNMIIFQNLKVVSIPKKAVTGTLGKISIINL